MLLIVIILNFNDIFMSPEKHYFQHFYDVGKMVDNPVGTDKNGGPFWPAICLVYLLSSTTSKSASTAPDFF